MKIYPVVLFALTTISAVAQSPALQSCGSEQTSLVGAFRVMNTAQLRFYGANHRYATQPELLNFEETRKLSSNSKFSQPVPRSVVLTSVSGQDPLPGYDLRITTAADGKSYVITANRKDGDCKLAGAMTDERGVIYTIEPLR